MEDNLDAAFAQQLQANDKRAEVVWRGEDLKSLHTAQILAFQEEKYPDVNAKMLEIIEDKLSIT